MTNHNDVLITLIFAPFIPLFDARKVIFNVFITLSIVQFCWSDYFLIKTIIILYNPINLLQFIGDLKKKLFIMLIFLDKMQIRSVGLILVL